MEREIERVREREPVEQDTALEEMVIAFKNEVEALKQKPHVLKNSQVPWTQGMQAYHKNWIISPHFTDPPQNWVAPHYNFRVLEQIIPPGSRSGKHRHYPEAAFYIIEGRGYEIHDEKKYPWEAGDIFCVPTYCVHQHFTEPDSSARLFYVVPLFFSTLGLAETEQIETHPLYKLSEESRALMGIDDDLAKHLAVRQAAPRFEGEVKTTYDLYRKQLADEVQWRLNCPHVVKGSERPWEDTAMGRIKYMVHPTIPSGLVAIDAWIQEIPPGGRSGKHRHVAEELHKILEGEGYDIHDGVRWDWEKEDVVVIPSHTVHQHFNASPDKPARFLAYQCRIYSFFGHGGVEHLEDAP